MGAVLHRPGRAGPGVVMPDRGEEPVITVGTGSSAAEIPASAVGAWQPSICDVNYPDHRAATGRASSGPGPAPRPRSWRSGTTPRQLTEAAAVGAQRIRTKMARVVELVTVAGMGKVAAALGLAAIAGRFGRYDLPLVRSTYHEAASRGGRFSARLKPRPRRSLLRIRPGYLPELVKLDRGPEGGQHMPLRSGHPGRTDDRCDRGEHTGHLVGVDAQVGGGPEIS